MPIGEEPCGGGDGMMVDDAVLKAWRSRAGGPEEDDVQGTCVVMAEPCGDGSARIPEAEASRSHSNNPPRGIC